MRNQSNKKITILFIIIALISTGIILLSNHSKPTYAVSNIDSIVNDCEDYLKTKQEFYSASSNDYSSIFKKEDENRELPENASNISEYDRIHFIDVGYGDATLIETSNGHFGLIDAGYSDDNHKYGNSAMKYLSKLNGFNRLDFIILTHSDGDHVGGMSGLRNDAGKNVLAGVIDKYADINTKYYFRRYQYNASDIAKYSDDGIEYTTGVTAKYHFCRSIISMDYFGNRENMIDITDNPTTINLGDKFTIKLISLQDSVVNNLTDELICVYNEGGSTKKVELNPQTCTSKGGTIYAKSENDNSIGALIKYNERNTKILLTGDMGFSDETRVVDGGELKFSENDTNKIDVYKMGHHGNTSSSSEKLIDAIEPKYSIISRGYMTHKENINTKAILDMQMKYGTKFMLTGAIPDGAIILNLYTNEQQPAYAYGFAINNAGAYAGMERSKTDVDLIKSINVPTSIDETKKVVIDYGYAANSFNNNFKAKQYTDNNIPIVTKTEEMTFVLKGISYNNSIIGKTHTGFYTDDDGTYYFDTASGKSLAERWCSDSSMNWYYFDELGLAVKGWKKINENWYYFNNNAIMQTGLQAISGEHYYFDEETGIMLTKKWRSDGNNWYYFDELGKAVKGFQELTYSGGTGKFYFNSNGIMQTNWQTINDKLYYFDSNGTMQTSDYTVDGKTYSFNSSGHLESINGNNPNGYLTIGNNWYYAESNNEFKFLWTKDKIYSYDDNKKIVYVIDYNTGINTFKDKLNCSSYVSIVNNPSGPIKTGDILRTTYSNKNMDYTLSVLGDVTGTGSIDINSAKLISQHIIDKNVLVGDEYLLAADYNQDSVIKINDVLIVLKKMQTNQN